MDFKIHVISASFDQKLSAESHFFGQKRPEFWPFSTRGAQNASRGIFFINTVLPKNGL